MAIEIVDFPINSMVIFHSKMLVHQILSDSTIIVPLYPNILQALLHCIPL